MTTAAINQVRRQFARHARRNTMRGAGVYLRLLERRGRQSLPEIVGFRWVMDQFLRMPDFRAPSDTRVKAVHDHFEGGQVRGEWVESPGVVARDTGAVLYVHGGGFVAGSPRTHRGLVAEISRRTGLPVFSLDYRLAPRHPFPAAPDDVLRAYRWLLDGGPEPTRVVVMGDSAGGHLALGLSPRAVRADTPVPAGVVALSPVVDLLMRASIARTALHPDPLVPSSAVTAVLAPFLGGHDPEHPELHLPADDLSVVPPTLIQYGSDEFLAGDIPVYAEAVEAAGSRCDLRPYERQAHVFQIAHRLIEPARAALDEIADFVADVTGGPEPGAASGPEPRAAAGPPTGAAGAP